MIWKGMDEMKVSREFGLELYSGSVRCPPPLSSLLFCSSTVFLIVIDYVWTWTICINIVLLHDSFALITFKHATRLF